jgi:hypothetical protein
MMSSDVVPQTHLLHERDEQSRGQAFAEVTA